jgi:hypothetical protein
MKLDVAGRSCLQKRAIASLCVAERAGRSRHLGSPGDCFGPVPAFLGWTVSSYGVAPLVAQERGGRLPDAIKSQPGFGCCSACLTRKRAHP